MLWETQLVDSSCIRLDGSKGLGSRHGWVLGSWETHITLTVPSTTKEYKWAQANFQGCLNHLLMIARTHIFPSFWKRRCPIALREKKNSLPPCICNRCIWTRSYNFTMLIEFTQRHLKRKTEELIKTWTASQVSEQLLVNKFAANETISQLCFCTAGRHHEVALPFCSVRSRFRQESWR